MLPDYYKDMNNNTIANQTNKPNKYKNIISLIKKAKTLTICIAISSPQDEKEEIYYGNINDFSLDSNGNLELWSNNGYEI